MRKAIIYLIVMALVFALGIGVGRYMTKPAAPTAQANKKPLYWIDPMEPTIRYDKPGKSRMGMDVVPVYAENETSSSQEPSITITPAVINNLGVRTAPVEQGLLAKPLQTVGTVEADEHAISHLHTFTEGWIQHLTVKAAGEPVKKGQPLAELYSPALVTAQEEYLIALEGHNTRLLTASHQKLRALGMAEPQIQTLKTTRKAHHLVTLFSPQAGIIDKLNIREGMRVTPDMELMSLVDLATVWIIADVPETQAAQLHVGQTAKATIPTFPHKSWEGQIDYIYPQLESATRTVKVRLRFPNPEGLLKPNMYANITLATGQQKTQVLSIPLEAVIPTSTGNRVIVAHDKGRFTPRAVTLGTEAGDRVEVLSGLKSGEQVVTSAQFLIDSEANLKATLERMTDTTLPQVSAAPPITGVGVVKAINKASRQITLQHEAIPTLQWPAMTMNFSVAKTIDLTPLTVGSKLHFTLQKGADDQWMITEFKKQ